MELSLRSGGSMRWMKSFGNLFLEEKPLMRELIINHCMRDSEEAASLEYCRPALHTVHWKLFSELMIIEMGARIFWTIGHKSSSILDADYVHFQSRVNRSSRLLSICGYVLYFEVLCRCYGGLSPKLQTPNLPAYCIVSACAQHNSQV